MLNQNPSSEINSRIIKIIREIEDVKRELRMQGLQRIPNDAPHNAVTLDSDADAILSLTVQVIGVDTQTGNKVLASPVAGSGKPVFRTLAAADIPFSAVSLAADADTILGLTGQQLTLDTQSANLVWAGPSSGSDADPTFRALVAADIPTAIGWSDGWISYASTFTYASSTSFTVTGDNRAVFPVGTKIKLTQTTDKYFYVLGATYSAPNTTVTVTGGSDYSLANAAITSPNYSYAETPRGFPDWFNWSPSFTGYSANPSGGIYRFKIEGRMVTAVIREPNTGTSNAGSLTITAPVTAATITNMTWLTTAALSNNSVTLTTWGRGRIGTGESSFTFGTDPSIDGGFTSSNGKRVAAFQINYEI